MWLGSAPRNDHNEQRNKFKGSDLKKCHAINKLLKIQLVNLKLEGSKTFLLFFPSLSRLLVETPSIAPLDSNSHMVNMCVLKCLPLSYLPRQLFYTNNTQNGMTIKPPRLASPQLPVSYSFLLIYNANAKALQ